MQCKSLCSHSSIAVCLTAICCAKGIVAEACTELRILCLPAGGWLQYLRQRTLFFCLPPGCAVLYDWDPILSVLLGLKQTRGCAPPVNPSSTVCTIGIPLLAELLGLSGYWFWVCEVLGFIVLSVLVLSLESRLVCIQAFRRFLRVVRTSVHWVRSLLR